MEEIKYLRTIRGITFEIIARKGNRKYAFDKDGKDRLYFLRLSEGDNKIEFPYSHDNQIELLRLVLDNVIIDRVFRDDLQKFKDALTKLENDRNENA